MLKLWNTMTRRKEDFKPLGEIVGIYTCGPSVYQYAHIGNFRTFVFEDVFVRYLRFKGYKVKRVMNITDIEDKVIETARKEGRSAQVLTEFYSEVFFEDMKALNLLPAEFFPRVTGHIHEIVEIIKKLLERNFAYCGADGSIYYDVSKFQDWGKLSRRKLKIGKKKIKRDDWGEDTSILSDFSLWKSYEKEDGDVFWETELGKGRPGWHIECSAMSSKYLGTRFDIHMGGVDNIYSHHESVIAQNFGAFGENPSKYWIHCRHLMVNGRKMSKSAGNFYTLRDLIDIGFDPMTIKYQMLSMSYRRRLNFTLNGIREAQKKIDEIKSEIEKLKNGSGTDDAIKIVLNARKQFERVMDDNLNTGKALKVIEEFTDDLSKIDPDKVSSKHAIDSFNIFDNILGLGFFNKRQL